MGGRSGVPNPRMAEPGAGFKGLVQVIRQAVSTSFDKNTTQLLTQSMGAAWHLGNSGEPQGGTDMGGFAG